MKEGLFVSVNGRNNVCVFGVYLSVCCHRLASQVDMIRRNMQPTPSELTTLGPNKCWFFKCSGWGIVSITKADSQASKSREDETG